MFNRKNFIPSFLALSLGAAAVASAATVSASDRRVVKERFTEYADVIDVRPVYKDIRVSEPLTQCWTEKKQQIVGYQRPRFESHQAHRSGQQYSSGSAVVGGLIGGVIGNQLGRGHSKRSRTGATIAGAIIGSAIGNEAHGDVVRHRRTPPARHQQDRPVYETIEVERCKEVSTSRFEQRIQNYDVTYRYKGRTFTTRMKRDPGRQIELQVTVAPARQ